MNDQHRIETAADNCEVLRARLAKYEDAEGRPVSALAEQAREIERLRLNIAEYNEHERCYQAEIAALKAQPSGVVQWPDADEIMQMAFEEGQPSEDASGYYFELEEFDLFIQRLMEEVARLNSSPVIAGEPVYQFQCREIGEGGFEPCDYSRYLYCQKSPEHDTRVVQVGLQAPSHGELSVLREYRTAIRNFNDSHGVETDTLDEAVEIERKAEARLEAAEKACHDFYAGRKQEPSHGEQVREWVPVSERLPNIAQEVIVHAQFDGVCAGVLDSYGEWFAPSSDYKLTRVNSWMPLPAAPSAGSQEQGE